MLKCPFCNKLVQHVNGAGVSISMGVGGATFHGVTYGCPFCGSVIGCQIDPVALRTDTIEGTVRALSVRLNDIEALLSQMLSIVSGLRR